MMAWLYWLALVALALVIAFTGLSLLISHGGRQSGYGKPPRWRRPD